MSWYWKVVQWLTVRPRLNRLERLMPEAQFFPCGSRYVCDPPVISTDIDFLVYCKDNLGSALIAAGFRQTTTNYPPSEELTVWRRGVVNLTVTQSVPFANAHIASTFICKKYNLRLKIDRVLVYENLRNVDYIDPTDYFSSGLNEELKATLRHCVGVNKDIVILALLAKYGISRIKA